MNSSQMLLHIARRASDRLAMAVSPDLPRAVSEVLAQADPHGIGTTDEVPPANNPAALVARCAIVGWQATQVDGFGGGQPAGPGPVDDARLRERLEAQLRQASGRPPGMDEAQYDLVLQTVADEIANATHRKTNGG